MCQLLNNSPAPPAKTKTMHMSAAFCPQWRMLIVVCVVSPFTGQSLQKSHHEFQKNLNFPKKSTMNHCSIPVSECMTKSVTVESLTWCVVVFIIEECFPRFLVWKSPFCCCLLRVVCVFVLLSSPAVWSHTAMGQSMAHFFLQCSHRCWWWIFASVSVTSNNGVFMDGCQSKCAMFLLLQATQPSIHWMDWCILIHWTGFQVEPGVIWVRAQWKLVAYCSKWTPPEERFYPWERSGTTLRRFQSHARLIVLEEDTILDGLHLS